MGQIAERIDCFNTQPPEGGWLYKPMTCNDHGSFNTQPPEGGWRPSSFK